MKMKRPLERNSNGSSSSNKSSATKKLTRCRRDYRTANQATSRPFTRSQASSQNKMKQLMVTPNESNELPPDDKITCVVCLESKTDLEMFRNSNVCVHVYCSECIIKHVAEKIKINITKVKCPDPNCEGVIEPEVCRSIVPKEMLERWENALCESLIVESEKFYCPFKDCSAMLVKDGCVTVTSSECPHCHRLFCAHCKVPWHSDLDCNDFEKVKKGEIDSSDLKLMNLAKNKKWMRCPKCNFFVEKKHGCDHIVCRCGRDFCYRCGNIGTKCACR